MIRFPSIKSSPLSDSFAPVVNVNQSFGQRLTAGRDEDTEHDGERSFRLDRSSPKVSREHSSKESPPRSSRSGSPGSQRAALPKNAPSSPNSSKMYRELILPKLVVRNENNSVKENKDSDSLSTMEHSYGGSASMTNLTSSEDQLSSHASKTMPAVPVMMTSQSRSQLPNLGILIPDAGTGSTSFDETAIPWLNVPSSARLLPMISRLNVPSIEIPSSTINQKTGSYSVPLRRLKTLGLGSPFANSDDATSFRQRSPSDPQGEEMLIKGNMRKHAMTPARIRRMGANSRLSALSPLPVGSSTNETVHFFGSPLSSNKSESVVADTVLNMQSSPIAITENLSEKEVQEFIQEAVFLANSSAS